MPHTWQGIAALTAMAFISQAGGQGLLAVALGRLPPVFSSLVIFLEAIVAALFGWLILGEALTLIQSLGGALILLGIWAARPRPPAARVTVCSSPSPLRTRGFAAPKPSRRHFSRA